MDNATTLNEHELSAFAHKLNAWSASLETREREFLNQMLADAAFLATSDGSGFVDIESFLDDDDVQGFDMDPAFGLTASIFEYGRGVTQTQDESAVLEAMSA